jgi:PEP-CTERM motif
VAYRVGSEDWTLINQGNVSAFALLGTAVPEPSAMMLVACGIVAFFGLGHSIRRLPISQ